MIQDIGTGRFDNQYRKETPKAGDHLMICDQKKVYVLPDGDLYRFPVIGEGDTSEKSAAGCRYLFSIDREQYFLGDKSMEEELPGGVWKALFDLRKNPDHAVAYAGVIAIQIAEFYRTRRYCPACGSKMEHAQHERMMKCPACGDMEYPKISPAVIVAVRNKDKLLMTKYAGRAYTHYALIAGFNEVGESIEETVHREVLEECGVKVKNLQYYKSQPWGFTDTLLMGFFCELDGSDEIRLDEQELAVGKWCTADEIPGPDGVSLTNEMMQVVKNALQ